MEVQQDEVIQYIQETSQLFAKLYAKYGENFLKEYAPHHKIMLNFFAALKNEDLKLALQLPNNAFRGLIEDELKTREAKIESMRLRGRLRRLEGQACLI